MSDISVAAIGAGEGMVTDYCLTFQVVWRTRMALPASPTAWQFKSSGGKDSPRWSWERFEDGRMISKSDRSFASLSDAMADARKHSFNDAHDEYSIV